jgi:hypothetical protein
VFETVLPFLFVAAALAVMIGVDRLSPKSRASRAIRRAPHRLIADVVNGAPARITGAVRALGQTMKAPIGETACIGFRIEIARLVGRTPMTVIRGDECPPFAMADESGTATVDGPMLLGLDWEDGWSPLPEREFALLDAAGVSREGSLFPDRFVFRQALLRSGDRVTASGVAFLEADPSLPTIEMRAPAVRPHLRGTNADPVAVVDPVAISGPA